VSDGRRSRALGTVEWSADGCKACPDTVRDGKMPLRQAQGKLSRQPAGPFDSAQGRPQALQANSALEAPGYFQPSLRDFTKPPSRESLKGMLIQSVCEAAAEYFVERGEKVESGCTLYGVGLSVHHGPS
jgi:hypothetical protein